MILSPFQLPFEECASVATARKVARRLAGTTLPVILRGEQGTGRFTLADAVAMERTSHSSLARIDASDPSAGQNPARIPTSGGILIRDYDLLSPLFRRVLIERAASNAVWAVVVCRPNSEAPTELFTSAIDLPPLRERPEILEWASLFLKALQEQLGLKRPVHLTRATRNSISTYAWPGNLHELRNRLERAVVLSPESAIAPEHLELEEGMSAVQPLDDAVREFKRTYISNALARFKGNRTVTARALQVDPRTIFRFLEAEASCSSPAEEGSELHNKPMPTRSKTDRRE